jgi:hypothetical protein
MNTALQQAIVRFLRFSDPAGAPIEQLKSFRSIDWESVLDWMDLSGIALIFHDRLKQLGPPDIVPREVKNALEANFENQRRRVEEMLGEFDSLNAQFKRAGVEYAAWKGFSLMPDYCPAAALRPTYDYDYLISERSLRCAREVLEGSGYTYKPERGRQNSLNFVPRQSPVSAMQAQHGLYAASFSRKVELHTKLWDDEAFAIPLRVPENPLDRRFRHTVQSATFFALAAEDAFLFQCLHIFQHVLHNWCRLGWLWEMAYFLHHRRDDTQFWGAISTTLRDNRELSAIVALAMTLATRLFHAPMPPSVITRHFGPEQSWIGVWTEQYGLSSAFDNFSENKYSLFLYREFVRDEAVWRQIRKSRLVPLHRPNHVSGTASPGLAPARPSSWEQSFYVVQRLIHHSVHGASYALESRRWDRLRRQSARLQESQGCAHPAPTRV